MAQATLPRRRRRRRKRQPKRLPPHPAGSPEAVAIVRGFIASELRRRAAGEEWRAVLRKREIQDRRALV